MPIRDDDNPSLDPREFPDPDTTEEASLLPCPNCLAVICEETQQCPRCGEYLAPADFARKPLWFILAAVVCLILVLLGIWYGF